MHVCNTRDPVADLVVVMRSWQIGKSFVRAHLRRRLRGELRQECERFAAGADWSDGQLQGLAIVAGALRLVPTSERPIEAQHAKTHKRGLGKHHHTEAFMSFGLRVPELVAAMEKDPAVMREMAYISQVLPNARDACTAVGMRLHPSVLSSATNKIRHPMFSKVIYHADSYSLYHAAPPDVQAGGDDGGSDSDSDHDDRPDGNDGHVEEEDHGDGGPVDGADS